MRFAPLLVPLLLSSACVDSPITAAHLAPDGQLRDNLAQDAFADPTVEATAERLELTGVLAVQDGGPLQDTTTFSREASVDAVHLHLRADNLQAPRAVRFVWRHGEQSHEAIDFLLPSDTLAPAASLSLSDAEPGTWSVEVYAVASRGEAPLLYQREFEVL